MPTRAAPDVPIDGERLWRSIHELAQIGAFKDARSGLFGVNRLALSDADGAARRLVKRWFEEAGLEVRIDGIGNTYGRRLGAQPELGVVLSGSHIDSVPTGGAFDGTLGVLGALEAVRALNDAGITTQRGIEIAFFTDEEGARFGTDMLGSATACGRLALDDALGLRDSDGRSVAEELERIGFRGEAAVRSQPPAAFVELHIEQGPILAAEGFDLGIVTGVQAISWHELTIDGKAAHAGTTPMALRHDAGVAASMINVRLHEMARSGDFGPQMRATMGRLEVHPNRINVVPRRVTCTLDLRNPDDAAMAATETAVTRCLADVAAALGVRIQRRQTAKTPRISFNEGVSAVIEEAMQRRELSYGRLLSGAGHDAQEWAAVCSAGMIFVPGLYDGISHSPRELSTQQACSDGAQVLLDSLLQLASSGVQPA